MRLDEASIKTGRDEGEITSSSDSIPLIFFISNPYPRVFYDTLRSCFSFVSIGAESASSKSAQPSFSSNIFMT